jgi:hypothetical protein
MEGGGTPRATEVSHVDDLVDNDDAYAAPAYVASAEAGEEEVPQLSAWCVRGACVM